MGDTRRENALLGCEDDGSRAVQTQMQVLLGMWLCSVQLDAVLYEIWGKIEKGGEGEVSGGTR